LFVCLTQEVCPGLALSSLLVHFFSFLREFSTRNNASCRGPHQPGLAQAHNGTPFKKQRKRQKIKETKHLTQSLLASSAELLLSFISTTKQDPQQRPPLFSSPPVLSSFLSKTVSPPFCLFPFSASFCFFLLHVASCPSCFCWFLLSPSVVSPVLRFAYLLSLTPQRISSQEENRTRSVFIAAKRKSRERCIRTIALETRQTREKGGKHRGREGEHTHDNGRAERRAPNRRKPQKQLGNHISFSFRKSIVERTNQNK